ncbi:hypothetical protein NEMBOFW57_004372 [Staphylotrichum longicolle]|uniref:Pcf11 Clp1-ID domain-containing protein n=1 Tax=Staphylotrichum longicolle TaxID=669026 RepID=A0AAD4I431_9PEZI|nr:hypothetical protein NEMBOFW57_004372 [Staphylotrichum longicolle]
MLRQSGLIKPGATPTPPPCGRRFKTTEEGRRKKTAHMDWHFRVHQRMTDAEKRGQHRSWYVDELHARQQRVPDLPRKVRDEVLDEAQEWVWTDADEVGGLRGKMKMEGY